MRKLKRLDQRGSREFANSPDLPLSVRAGAPIIADGNGGKNLSQKANRGSWQEAVHWRGAPFRISNMTNPADVRWGPVEDEVLQRIR